MRSVSEGADQLPTDVAALQALLVVARAEREAAIAERDQALAQNHRLQHMLHQLQRMQFGGRSEKLDRDQLQLAFEDVEQAVAATEAADDKHDPVAYFADVLAKLVNLWPASRLDDLMPWAWAAERSVNKFAE